MELLITIWKVILGQKCVFLQIFQMRINFEILSLNKNAKYFDHLTIES